MAVFSSSWLHLLKSGSLRKSRCGSVEHYNHARAHESLSNLTPADVYLGRGEAILLERERIKRQTLARRRLHHHAQAA
jgi:putative transposase